jgi:hypothetical protein
MDARSEILDRISLGRTDLVHNLLRVSDWRAALEKAKMDVDQFFATHSAGSSLAVWTFANAGPVNLTGGFVSDAAAAY